MKAHIIAVALLLALASSTFLERKKNKRKTRQQILCCNDLVKGWEEFPYKPIINAQTQDSCASRIDKSDGSNNPDIYYASGYNPNSPSSGACCTVVGKDANSCYFRFGNQKKASKRRRARRMRRRRA